LVGIVSDRRMINATVVFVISLLAVSGMWSLIYAVHVFVFKENSANPSRGNQSPLEVLNFKTGWRMIVASPNIEMLSS